jgi:hypothetical protein
MTIELMEYAPDFIKNIAKEKAPNAKAYTMFRMYDHRPQEYPQLRDRTEEMELALSGLVGGVYYFTTIDGKGSDLTKYGYASRGADYEQTFRIIFA